MIIVAIGSNLDNPAQQVLKAVERLNDHANITVINTSKWYQSAPIGPQDQEHFVNGVVAIKTDLSPIELLDELQNIEQLHERKRIQHWGPRTIDLDLICYNDQQINSPRLTVPHPLFCERAFVLKPLADIAPLLVINQQTIEHWLSQDHVVEQEIKPL